MLVCGAGVGGELVCNESFILHACACAGRVTSELQSIDKLLNFAPVGAGWLSRVQNQFILFSLDSGGPSCAW